MTIPMPVLMRKMAVVLVLLVGAATAGGAHAAGARRVGILKFRGPAEGATRNAVGRAVKSAKYQIVGAQQIDKTAKKLGAKLNTDDGFVAVARELGISAFVLGEVTKKKATLTIRGGADGAVGAEATWVGANPRKLAAAVEKTFWKRLGGAIDQGKAPSGAKQAAVAEETAAPEAPEEATGGAAKTAAAGASSEESESSRDKGKKKTAAASDEESDSESGAAAKARASSGPGPAPGTEGLDVAVGVGILTRSLSYKGNFSKEPKYGLPLGPELALRADVFPAVILGQEGLATRFGLTFGLSALIPGTVTTNAPAGTAGNYSTRSTGWYVGLKVRLPKSLFVTAAYGDRAFGLNAAGGAPASLVPTTDYRYFRIGGGGRWRLSPEFSFMANLAYLRALSFGSIAGADYYPKTTGGALEVGVTAGYRITSRFEARLGAEMQRFGLAFNVPYSANPPARIVGGAIDQYVSLLASVAYVLGAPAPH